MSILTDTGAIRNMLHLECRANAYSFRHDIAQYSFADGSFSKNNDSVNPAFPFANRTILSYRKLTYIRAYTPGLLAKTASICSFAQWRRESRRRPSQFDEIYYPTFRLYDSPFSQCSTARFLVRLTATPRKAKNHMR